MLKTVLKTAGLASAVLFSHVQANEPVANSNSELLNAGFPRAFYFRIPQRIEFHENYQAWANEYSRLNGMVSKIGFEEIAYLPHEQLTRWMTQFSKDYPQQSVVLHFNSFARDPFFIEENRFFPGHWLYLPGATVTSDISKQDKTIEIDGDPEKLFVVNRPFLHYKEGVSDELVIVPVDESGRKDWNNAEYVKLTEINKSDNKITVERGHVGSERRTFNSGKAYIAPIATMGPYGQPEEKNHKLWVYNMSENSPRDNNGRRASDVLVEEFRNWFAESGKLASFKGVAFDLPFWDIEARKFLGRRSDANSDGLPDGAVFNGVNSWESGVRDFYVNLKNAIGENYIVTADTQYIFNQRAVDILDGMESEGVVDHADGYKGISTTINHSSYWKKYAVTKTPFNYTFYKDNSKDKRNELDKARYGFTMAQNLGLVWGVNKQIMAPEPGYKVGMLDEVLKGEAQQKNWLGQPVGEAIRKVDTLPDVLNRAGITMSDTFTDLISSNNAKLSIEGKSLIVRSKSPKQKKTIFSIKGIELPEGDATLLYETMARSQLVIGGKKVDSPYQIEMKIKGQKTPKNLKAKHILGYTGAKGFSQNEAYIRESGPAKVSIDFIIRGAGEFEFRNFAVMAGVPFMAREFEHGAVISNPSVEEICVDTGSLFPGKSLAYFKGKQNPVLNSGKPVENNQVCVPPVNGVALTTIED